MGTILKRGSSYRAVIRRIGTKPLTRTFAKKALAQQWVQEQDRIATGRRDAGGHRVGPTLDRFIREVLDKRPYSVRSYRSHLMRAVRWFETDHIADCDSAWWIAFAQRLTVQPQSRKKYLTEVAGVLRSAEEMGWLSAPIHWTEYRKAMATLQRLKLVGKKKHRERRISAEEEEQIKGLCAATAALRGSGLRSTPPRYSLDTKRAAVAAYRGGMKLPQVAKQFNIASPAAIYKWLRGEGIDKAEPHKTTKNPAMHLIDFPMADILDMALELALRQEEICTLRWSDLVGTNDEKMIWVRNRKHNDEKVGNDWLIPLLGRSWEIIQRQRRIPPAQAAKLGIDADLIFPYKPATIGSVFRKMVKKIGITDLTFHDSRHEGISRLFEQGYQIQEVALISGHRDWASLKIYAQIKPKDLHKGPASRRPIPAKLLAQLQGTGAVH